MSAVRFPSSARVLAFGLAACLGLAACAGLPGRGSAGARTAERGAESPSEGGGVPAVEPATAAEYQAAYCYALACLAAFHQDFQDQALLLARAQQADPGSELLAKERAGVLSALGRRREAAGVLARSLRAHPADLALRRALAGLYQDLGAADQARALFLGKGGRLPKDPGSIRPLAVLDDEDGDDAEAVRLLEPLLGRGASADDRELLGLCLEKLGRTREALAQYRALTAEDPTRDAAWGRIAACEQAQGDTAAARAALEAGFKASPKSPLLADQLGRFLYDAKDYAGAAAAFDRLAALDPGDGRVLFYRGLARFKAGRWRAAEADLRRAGRLQGPDTDQTGVLALDLLAQKKYAPACAALERLVRLEPASEQSWGELSYAENLRAGPRAAARALERGLKALPDDRALVLLLAEARQDAGDLGGAARALRQALDLEEDPDVRFELAAVLDKRGRFPEAERELRKVLAESPRDAEALNYLGYSWVDRGEHLAQAEALIRRALAVEPDNPYYLDSLGWDLHREGRDRPALAALLRASKPLRKSSDPDEAVVFDHLARVERDLGRTRTARAAEAQASLIRARARERKGRAAVEGDGSGEE